MAQFNIKSEIGRVRVQELYTISDVINDYFVEVDQIGKEIRKNSLRSTWNSVEAAYQKGMDTVIGIGRLGDALDDILLKYEETERRLVNQRETEKGNGKSDWDLENRQSLDEEKAESEEKHGNVNVPPSSAERDQEIINEIQSRFESFRGKKDNWAGKCGALTYWQLESQGLGYTSTERGADLAKAYAQLDATNGYYCDANNAGAVFDQMVNEYNGVVSNVIVSFDHGQYGHAMLISRIENGKVYFIDNWKDYSDGKGGYVAQVLTIEEYKSRYFSWGGYSCNCMTVVG